MPRGGARAGAGRKKGAKSKMSELRQRIATMAVLEAEITPLHVMLQAMANAWNRGDQDKAAAFAKEAAPYVHPRLANIEHKGDPENPLETVTRIELVAPTPGHGNR